MIYGVMVTFYIDCNSEHEALETAGRLTCHLKDINSLVVIPKCEECNAFHEEDAIEPLNVSTH